MIAFYPELFTIQWICSCLEEIEAVWFVVLGRDSSTSTSYILPFKHVYLILRILSESFSQFNNSSYILKFHVAISVVHFYAKPIIVSIFPLSFNFYFCYMYMMSIISILFSGVCQNYIWRPCCVFANLEEAFVSRKHVQTRGRNILQTHGTSLPRGGAGEASIYWNTKKWHIGIVLSKEEPHSMVYGALFFAWAAVFIYW